MKRLLLYTCCAPCLVYPIEKLVENFDITVYFFAPNIHPHQEYIRRLEAIRTLRDITRVALVETEYEPEGWFEQVRGLEREKEGGRRCEVCFRMRLEKAAEFASAHNYDIFSETLSISPHKDRELIWRLGREAGKEYGCFFSQEDFRSDAGFQKGCALGRSYNLYRQRYCGCEFSYGGCVK